MKYPKKLLTVLEDLGGVDGLMAATGNDLGHAAATLEAYYETDIKHEVVVDLLTSSKK